MRFDYVEYDSESKELNALLIEVMRTAETVLNQLPEGRARALALTKLEESCMWGGKAIRDGQVQRQC